MIQTASMKEEMTLWISGLILDVPGPQYWRVSPRERRIYSGCNLTTLDNTDIAKWFQAFISLSIHKPNSHLTVKQRGNVG